MRGKLCQTLEERFEEFTFYSPDGCWYWLGSYNNHYGQIYHNGRSDRAHRVSYLFHKGPITSGLCVLHTCDNPKCINPDHLYLGTQLQNIRDMHDRKRNVDPPKQFRYGNRN